MYGGVTMCLKYNVNKKAFGEKVRKCRENKGLTQEKLAELLGKDVSYVSLIECGNDRANPTYESIIGIVNCLNINPDYLMADSIVTIEKLSANNHFLLELLKHAQNLPEELQENVLNIAKELEAAYNKIN